MQGRKKLTPAQQAKRDAKRLKRAEGAPPEAKAGPTLRALVARDDLVRVVGKATRALIEQATAHTEAVAKTHLRVITCHACTEPGCCNLPIEMMFHEALPAADRIRRDGRDTPALRAQLAEAAQLMETLPRREYRALARPCVFLHDRRCSVYEDRPRACGSHFVFSPMAECADPAIEVTESARVDADAVLREVWQTAKVVDRALGLAHIEGRYTGVLPRMVLWWLETFDRTDFVDVLADWGRAANARA